MIGSDFNYDEYLKSIRTAPDVATLDSLKFDQPGNWDRRNGWTNNDVAVLEKFREAQRPLLLQQEAAPVAAEAYRLKSMAANDPYIGSPEGLADFAQRPDFWLGRDNTGVISGAKKGTVATAAGANPYTAGVVQKFGEDNQNILDLFKANDDPMAAARLMTNKDLSNNFKDVTQGQQNSQAVMDALRKPKETAAAQKQLSDFFASTSMLTTPSERTGKMMPFSEASSLIQQAASDYPVPAEVVNKVTDNLLSQYDKTRIPVSGKVGRTTWTGTQNLMGDINKDVTSVAPVTNNHIYAAAGAGAVTSWADRIAAGQATINEVPRQTKDAVMADLGLRYPNANLSELKANQKYQQASGNLQSRALIQGVAPLYDKLLETGKTLGNSRIPGANTVVNWMKEQSGNPDIVAFNNLRDDVIAESERILLGSGVLSDSKYMRAVKNVNSAQSYPQLQAAVKQLRLTVQSRAEALDKAPYQNAGGNKPATPQSYRYNPKTGTMEPK